jgi:hypothetical protein
MVLRVNGNIGQKYFDDRFLMSMIGRDFSSYCRLKMKHFGQG